MNERRLTHSAVNHVLTNANVWSHDGQWIYYDTRSADDCFDGQRIERVHSITGEVQVVFQARNGAYVGVVTASPTDDRIVFIHGPENPTDDWQYAAYHRRGVIVSPGEDMHAANLDARDVVAPFTPGALRGGSHVHVFGPDGAAISFTYEDHVLAMRRGDADGRRAEQNQRNVGVSVSNRPVKVPCSHHRNHDGSHFTFLATQTHDLPTPGSDQIGKAYEEAWIHKSPGSLDANASTGSLAFIGNVVSSDGQIVPELFVVQLPADCTVPGDGPLEGTATTRPRPPRGTVQRRLTHTVGNAFTGLACDVRHWPRSSYDGQSIAFLMRDSSGIVQLWLISPTGDALRQLTRGADGVTSSFTFRNDCHAIACVIGGSVCEVDVHTGSVTALTTPDRESPPMPMAVVYSPDGIQIAYTRMVNDGDGLRSHVHVVSSGRSDSGVTSPR